MRFYDKFFVLKKGDIPKYLSPEQQLQLQAIGQTVMKGRKGNGKIEHCYFVVNGDEPYAKQVQKLIEEGEQGKEI